MSEFKENILARIPDEYVGAALKTLPDCNTLKDDFKESIIDVPGFRGGAFYLPARKTARHHKFRSVFWIAIKVVKVV